MNPLVKQIDILPDALIVLLTTVFPLSKSLSHFVRKPHPHRNGVTYRSFLARREAGVSRWWFPAEWRNTAASRVSDAGGSHGHTQEEANTAGFGGGFVYLFGLRFVAVRSDDCGFQSCEGPQ